MFASSARDAAVEGGEDTLRLGAVDLHAFQAVSANQVDLVVQGREVLHTSYHYPRETCLRPPADILREFL